MKTGALLCPPAPVTQLIEQQFPQPTRIKADVGAVVGRRRNSRKRRISLLVTYQEVSAALTDVTGAPVCFTRACEYQIGRIRASFVLRLLRLRQRVCRAG